EGGGPEAKRGARRARVGRAAPRDRGRERVARLAVERDVTEDARELPLARQLPVLAHNQTGLERRLQAIDGEEPAASRPRSTAQGPRQQGQAIATRGVARR